MPRGRTVFYKQGHFGWMVGGFIALLPTAYGFAVSGHNVVAQICFGFSALFGIATLLIIEEYYGRRRAFKITTGILVISGMVGIDYWATRGPASVLRMEAHMYGNWGPKVPLSEVDLDINNVPGDAIHNLELIVRMASKKRIKTVSQMAGDECRRSPTNDFGHIRATVKGSDGAALTLDGKEYVDEYFKQYGSVQWKLECPDVSEQPPLFFRLQVNEDAENDFLIVSGKYEVYGGNKPVKVNEKVLVTK